MLVDERSPDEPRVLASQTPVVREIQKICAKAGESKNDRLRRIWEPTYTIMYKKRAEEDAKKVLKEVPWDVSYVEQTIGTDSLPKIAVINFLQRHADLKWLKTWNLNGKARVIAKSRNCRQVAASYRDYVQLVAQSGAPLSSPRKSAVEESRFLASLAVCPFAGSDDSLCSGAGHSVILLTLPRAAQLGGRGQRCRRENRGDTSSH